MGRGDKKTKKGKIARGSYGKTRKRKTSAPIVASTKPKKKVAPKKVETEEVVKPVAKKVAAKKTAVAAEKKPAAKKTTAAVKKPAAAKKPAAVKKPAAEKKGISDKVEEIADQLVRIPMYGFTESFNISVSAAIALNILRRNLNQSNIDWKLSHEEQVKLKIQWCTKIIRDGEMVENEIRRRHFEKE